MERAVMSKVDRFPRSIPARSAASDEARRTELDVFVSVALFSGIGLLISLVAVLCGMPGAWY
jgi:hypothetical protein